MPKLAPRLKRETWLSVVICVVLAALVWAVFGQTMTFGFVNYDDPLYVLQNPNIRDGVTWAGIKWAFTHIHSQNWHPLTSISHMLDCQLFGPQAGGHHFVNVLLHTIAAIVLFLALKNMTGPSSPRDESARRADGTTHIWRTAFVAAVFAIHPLRVESVAWISERKDVLSALFFMCALAAYARYARTHSKSSYRLVLIPFALGLMSKPMLITLPVVLLLLDYWPLGRFGVRSNSSRSGGEAKNNFWRLFVEKIPLFALSAASCVATLAVQNLAIGTIGHLPLAWRLTNAVMSYVEYLRQMVWPAGLMPFYIHPENRLPAWQIALALIFLVGISIIAVRFRRKYPYVFVGWSWYLVMLLPVVGIVQVGLQGHADRYTYLPQIGIYLAVTWTIGDLSQRWRARSFVMAPLAGAVIIALSVLAWRQTTHWRGTESLWRYTLGLQPDNDVALAGLGGTLLVQGKADEAISNYERAIRLRPGNSAAHHGLAIGLVRKQRSDEAIEHWRKSLAILPNNTEALNYLGIALARKGSMREAIAQWEKALAYEANDPDATNALAWVLATSPDAKLRNGARAVQLAERAVQLTNGADPVRLRTLAAAYAENGQFLAAVPTATKALELAEKNGNTALADHLRYCVDLFFRNMPLRDMTRSP